MNSLYNDFKPAGQSNQLGELIGQFRQFRSTFNGNPEAQVRQLMQSGRMSQEQFNQYAQMANQLQSLLK